MSIVPLITSLLIARPVYVSPDLGLDKCRNLIKKPWVFIKVPYMNPTIWGLWGQDFLIRFLHYPKTPKEAQVARKA